MINAEYFRRQAEKLKALAQSIKDGARARPYFAMAEDFRARADELEREGPARAFVRQGGSSDGEMDRD